MKYLLSIGFVLLMIGSISCNKEGAGTVSFGSNSSLMNCITESSVFIDDVHVGIIPGSCDSVVNCSGEQTLNVEVSEGEHSYRIEIVSSEGNCHKETTGEFSVSDGECVKIFFDIKNEISGEVVTRELVVYPEDSIYLEFELTIHVEKEPYTLQWIRPETFSGTGPFTVGLREDMLLDVIIIDSENQQFELKQTIQKDTIDPLKYDYRD